MKSEHYTVLHVVEAASEQLNWVNFLACRDDVDFIIVVIIISI